MGDRRIQESAQVLLDMLNMKGGEPMVDRATAHALFDAAYDRTGFDAVSSFLKACTEIKEADPHA